MTNPRRHSLFPLVLELQNICLRTGSEPDSQILLQGINAHFPHNHFAAIVGPSGCGKSTLIKIIAGIQEPTAGAVQWQGRNLALEEDLAPQETGYVPQFGIAYDALTVWESIETTLRLRVKLPVRQRQSRAEEILFEVGLEDLADRRVGVLSGGQKRRLALALEMVTFPALMLCDEVTSGLDPKAESEIVGLMRQLSKEDRRIVLCVTHSLRHIDQFDSVLVLYQGRLAYHGSTRFLLHYFNVQTAEDLFPRLSMRRAEDWEQSWIKHRAPYQNALQAPASETPARETLQGIFQDIPVRPPTPEPIEERPGLLTQFLVLLGRRWKLFLRDRGQIALHLALLFGFPCLVVIFAWDGLPQLQNLSMIGQTDIIQQLRETSAYYRQSSEVGSLVSGLIMFQVILLALMGSNNAAREIASERPIFEKEKFGGVRPSSYVLSKTAFLSLLVVAQSVWMGLFVNLICGFKGDLNAQITLLILVNAAMTAVSLGISSLMRSPEQASLVSVYLVGFQLPLSGAVLALPRTIAWLTRPFIASYWSWSGFLQTMRDTRFYDAVQTVTKTKLSVLPLCYWVLICHCLIGLFLAYAGCRNSRWDKT